MQIFVQLTLKNFRKNSNNSFQPIFKSLNIIVSFYTDKLTMSDFPMVFLRHRGKLDTQENTEYTCDQVSEGKLELETFVNLSIFNG